MTATSPAPKTTSVAESRRTFEDIPCSIAAAGSALMLWAAFPGNPPPNWDWFAWFALAPLFALVPSRKSPWRLYTSAWLGGLIFWHLTLVWIREIDPDAWLGWVCMAGFLSLWWPGFLWLARNAHRSARLPLVLAAPVAWVGLEYVRAHLLTGFPWYYLAHTQYRRLPLIQISDLTGAWGLSFLIAAVNALIAQGLATFPVRKSLSGYVFDRSWLRSAAVVAVALIAVVGYGTFRLFTAGFRAGPKLALLQSNIPQALKRGGDAATIEAVYRRLVARALSGEERPDLIVWPETSYPYRIVTIDPKLNRADFEKQAVGVQTDTNAAFWKNYGNVVEASLRDWVRETRVPMLIGALSYEFRPAGFRKFNSAVLIEPNRVEFASYHKLHLVPFGEYVPWIDLFPFLIELTPFDRNHVPSLAFGSEPKWFDLHGFRLATAICFEDTVPHVARRFVSEAGTRRPDVLLNISNDGWFGDTAEHENHLAAGVFRAVELRLPLARAVNTGVSALIDGNGEILKSIPRLKEGVLSVSAPLDGRRSAYALLGDWFAQLCLIACVLLLGVRFRRRPASP